MCEMRIGVRIYVARSSWNSELDVDEYYNNIESRDFEQSAL